MAAERVGLDPLAEEYVQLHERPQQMRYVAGGAEDIPFEDGHFDFVSTFNSLDHTDDVDAAIAEITRVTRPGGSLLFACDVGHEPTPTEPQAFGWEISRPLCPRLGHRLAPRLRAAHRQHVRQPAPAQAAV